MECFEYKPEWTDKDEIEAKDKEIERLADLNKAKGALIKAQAKKIGMLLKEKEWLLNELILSHIDMKKEEFIEAMQQALKEK